MITAIFPQFRQFSAIFSAIFFCGDRLDGSQFIYIITGKIEVSKLMRDQVFVLYPTRIDALCLRHLNGGIFVFSGIVVINFTKILVLP